MFNFFTDDRPCKIEIPEDLKRTALLTNLGCILICVILALLIWYNMALKVGQIVELNFVANMRLLKIV